MEEGWIVISGNQNGPNSTMDAVMQAKNLRVRVAFDFLHVFDGRMEEFNLCMVIGLIELDLVVQIAEAQSITVPKRYLLIVASGGLNQQRTGVIIC